jgi:hypothetical protein
MRQSGLTINYWYSILIQKATSMLVSTPVHAIDKNGTKRGFSNICAQSFGIEVQSKILCCDDLLVVARAHARRPAAEGQQPAEEPMVQRGLVFSLG